MCAVSRKKQVTTASQAPEIILRVIRQVSNSRSQKLHDMYFEFHWFYTPEFLQFRETAKEIVIFLLLYIMRMKLNWGKAVPKAV